MSTAAHLVMHTVGTTTIILSLLCLCQQVAKRELALECDYTYEAAAQQRYKALLAADPELHACFNVPTVVPELSREQVLTSEWVTGVSVDKVSADLAVLVQLCQMGVGCCMGRAVLDIDKYGFCLVVCLGSRVAHSCWTCLVCRHWLYLLSMA